MAEPKSGEPFGLDQALLESIDWNLALERIIHDLRSDFIYAPHLAYIYRRAGAELINNLKSDLRDGTFFPGMPLTIEVPKSHRLRVANPLKRFGPSFSRPGSILMPKERLFYQALADQAAPIINSRTDHKRSFSHKLSPAGRSNMFLPTRTCWGALQTALKRHAASASTKYIVKIDIANFFGSLNQHTLVNVLADSGYPRSLASRLEHLLTSFTGERSSLGILQGIYPSDLFGNFYMAPVDRFLKELGHPSARYVDDLYIFVESVETSSQLMRELIPYLRSYDLVLNEAKCVIMPKNHLITEEPDLEALFSEAVEEISNQVEDDDFDADYGFQSEWGEQDDDETNEKSLELKATEILFDSLETYSGHEENIERFCLPIFAKAGSNYAVQSVKDSFKKRPAMTQIYASYLAKFISSKEIQEFLIGLLYDDTLNDWQKMWILAALLQVKPSGDDSTEAAVKILKDANRHDAVRAVGAIYVGRYGDHHRRKALATLYARASPYIQTAIYYSSSYWKGAERSNAKVNWGSHGDLNSLLKTALSKKSIKNE